MLHAPSALNLCLVLTIAVSLAPGVAGAEREIGPSYVVDDDDDLSDETSSPTASPGAPVVTEPDSPGRPVAFFKQLWRERIEAQSAGAGSVADRKLEIMVEAKESSGWPDFFVYGRVLVREAQKELAEQHVPRARFLAERAVALAPHAPLGYATLARAMWAGGEYFNAALALLDAIWVQWHEPPQWRTQWGNMMLAVVISMMLTGLGFALIALYRYLRAAAYDLRRLLPKGARRWQATLICATLVATPVLFRFGLAWTILCWVVLLGLYYRPKERIGAIIVLAVLAAVPIFLTQITAYWSYTGSRSYRVYRATRSLLAEDAEAAIRAEEKRTAEESYALGLRAVWSGRPREGLRWLTEAAQGGVGDPELFTLMGNLQFLLNDKEGAVGSYKRALEVSSKHVTALFNMSRVYFEMGEHQQGNAAYRKATGIDFELAERYARQAKTEGRGYVVPEGAPRRLLTLPFKADSAHERAVDRVWDWIGGGTPRLWFAMAAIMAVILLAVMAFIRKPVTYPELLDLPDPEGAGPVDSRVQKEIASHRYQASMARLGRFFSLLVAGGGQLTRGATLSGMLLMTVFLTGVLGVVAGIGVVPTPTPSAQTGLDTLQLVVAVVVALVTYLYALWDGAGEL